jgi:hypothetical protein
MRFHNRRFEMRKLLLIIAGTMMLTVPAMAIDFTTPITNLDGSQPVGTDGKPVDMRLSTICINALLATYPDEQSLPGTEKLRRYGLARAIQENQKIDLSAEDVALVKKLVEKQYGPLVVGQAWGLLDPVKKEK